MTTTQATYLCDRCGLGVTHTRVPGQFRPPGWDYFSMPDLDGVRTQYPELCGDCVRSLHRWLRQEATTARVVAIIDPPNLLGGVRAWWNRPIGPRVR